MNDFDLQAIASLEALTKRMNGAMKKMPAEFRLSSVSNQIHSLEISRERFIVQAVLEGTSQRRVAEISGLAVNTVREILKNNDVRYSGSKYTQGATH